MCHVIAKAELAKADLAGCTSIALMDLDRSDKCKHRLLSWLRINYMKRQINRSLHLEFVYMQATDKHILNVLICMWYLVTMSDCFALYQPNIIVAIISKY